MEGKLAALLLASLMVLSGCSQRATTSSGPQATESPAQRTVVQSPAVTKGGGRPVFWSPVYGTDVYDLRSVFPAVIPSYLPEGYALQFWSVGLVSNGENIDHAASVASAATLLLGPAGKPKLIIIESNADLHPPDPDTVQITTNASGSELTWSDGLLDGERQIHVLFQYDDVHVLATGLGMPKEEVMKVVASMKLR